MAQDGQTHARALGDARECSRAAPTE